MGLVLIFIAVLIGFCIVRSKFQLFRSGSRIPGPWFIPFVGNVQFMSQIRPEVLFVMVNKLRQTYRSSFRIWLGTQLWVFLHTAEETRDALNESSLTRADTFQLLNTLIGNGLLISEGKYWHSHRRALGPAFQPAILASFTERIYYHAEKFAERVLQKREINASDYVFPCVLDIICDTSMGKNFRTQEVEHSPYAQAFHEASHLLFKRMVNPILFYDIIYHRTASYKQLLKAVTTIHNMTDEVIRNQADYLKSQGNLIGDKYSYNRTLLQILLTSEIDGRPLTFQEIKDEVNTFLFAGVDTTAAAMNFILYCLAKHQECQEKLYAEISKASGDYSDMSELSYLDMFIKECLRLYTIVPLTGRQVTRNIKIGNMYLYQGTTIWINMYGLAHDEQYFPEPNRFNPERFAKDAPEISPFAFIPYSGGLHSCIGRKYAMLILKILVITTLKRTKVHLNDSTQELIMMAEMVLKAKNGIKVTFEKRVAGEQN